MFSLGLLERIILSELSLVLADEFGDIAEKRDYTLKIFLKVAILVLAKSSDLHVAEAEQRFDAGVDVCYSQSDYFSKECFDL